MRRRVSVHRGGGCTGEWLEKAICPSTPLKYAFSALNKKLLFRSQNSGSTDGGRSDKTAGKSKGVKTPAKGGRDRTATIKGRETKGREIQLNSFYHFVLYVTILKTSFLHVM